MTARWLPRTRDVTAVALGALVAVDALVEQSRAHHPVAAWATFLGAGVGAAALWWRRTHPFAITLLGLVLCVAVHIEWTLAVGLTTLAIRRRDRVTWLLAVSAVLALTTESLTGAVHGRPGLVGSLSLSVPWVALFTVTGAFLGQRRDAIAHLKERAERAEAEQEMRAEQSRLSERTRIAAEMHDVLAHRISLIALHAGGLEVTDAPSPAAVHQTAGLIRETAHTALEDLRGILGVLKSPDGGRAELAPQPRFADVEDLIRASAEAGIPITLSGGVAFDADVPEPLGRAAYRMVQECLTNVHKHAAGAETLIRLAGAPGRQLEICVENQAPPVPSPSLPGSGSGLVGLRERVTVAGGMLEARPLRGGGFRVRAWLPWAADANAADANAVEVEAGAAAEGGRAAVRRGSVADVLPHPELGGLRDSGHHGAPTDPDPDLAGERDGRPHRPGTNPGDLDIAVAVTLRPCPPPRPRSEHLVPGPVGGRR